MYVATPTQKIFDSLKTLAEENGWQFNYSRTGVNLGYLYFSNGEFWSSDYSYTRVVSLKSARRTVSRPIIKSGGYTVTKLDKGVKIGCTVVPNSVIKEVLKEIERKKIKLGNNTIKICDYGVGIDEENNDILSFDEVREIAKFAGVK